MDNRKTILLSLEFERTNWVGADVPTHITYTMRKKTPFGLLEAHATIKFLDFMARGTELTDGQMFTELGAALNREEQNRMLEVGANQNFGAEVTCKS